MVKELTEKEIGYKQFLLDILTKVKYLDYKFHYDSLSFPTEDIVEKLKTGRGEHKLRLNILHHGEDHERVDSGKSWLTYCGCVVINRWDERAIVEAIYITLIQKLRHEASEIFTYEDKVPFHEHRAPNLVIPQ